MANERPTSNVACLNTGKNKVSDVVDENSDSEVKEVFDETTCFMAFKSGGELGGRAYTSIGKMIMIITRMMKITA